MIRYRPRLRSRIRPCFVAVVGLWVLACKGEGGSIGIDEAAKEQAEAYCQAWFDCSCDESSDAFTSPEQCVSDRTAQAQRGVDEGKAAELQYHGECVDRSIDLVGSLQCTRLSELDHTIVTAYLELLGCKLFSGDKQGGESCTRLQESNSDDCVADHYCDAGICRPIADIPGPGEDCENFATYCKGGAVCVDIDEDGQSRCEVLPGSGETCLGSADACAQGFVCDQTSKTCMVAPAEGETCSGSTFAGNQCSEGLYCAVSQNTCEPLPQGGEPCFLQGCAEGFACQGNVCVAESPLICGVPQP